MNKFIGTYTIFKESDIHNNILVNQETGETNTYLKGKSGTEVYRYNKDTLAVYFPSNQTVKRLDEKYIKYSIFVQGDTEFIALVKEIYIDLLNDALKFMIRGKNQQLKEYKKKLKTMKYNKRQI